MPIAPLQIPSWPQADQREAEMLGLVLDSPQWGGFHPFVTEFEQSFAAFQHVKHGLSAANGSLTLEVMLEGLGIGPGDEVILPAISFITSATAISRVGATPVFADIGADTYNLDPARVREALSPQTKAVMAVHFGGTLCDMDALLRVTEEAGILLIEDAAHAHGAEWQGKRAGSFGIASSFSFQNGKCLTAGEGGLIATSDDTLAATLRSVMNCGRTPGRSFYEHARLGTNLRMTAFQAAVLLAQFERLPEQIARRTVHVELLKNELGACDALIWQRVPREVTQSPWYLVVGRLRGGRPVRDRLMQALKDAGVPATPFYPHTLYRNALYQNCGCRVMPCPEAEARVKDTFWLPHRLFLAEADTVRAVAQIIKQELC